MIESKLLYRCYDQTGEASTWFPSLDSFLWVDIDNGIMHQYNVNEKKVTDHFFPEVVTSIIPWKGHDEEVILTMKNRCIAYHIVNKTWLTLVDFTTLSPMFRTNDCKASPEGRIWCGIMHMKEHNGNASLYCVDNHSQITEVLTGQSIPNGLVWNKEGNRMYYADSGRRCIEEYAYDAKTGEITFLRTAVTVPEEYGVPDGMTIDANGNLWVAHWGGFGVYVWNPSNGELIDKISVPVPNVASCTFGGHDQKQLFITTAIDGLSEEEAAKYPLSGSLFVADVPNASAGENHYSFINLE